MSQQPFQPHSPRIPPKSVSQDVPLFCPICGRVVKIEAAKTDEYGKAIHEDCYVLKVQLKHASES